MPSLTPAVLISAVWVLLPLLIFGFFGSGIVRILRRLPLVLRLVLPAIFGVPYILVSSSNGTFQPDWAACYLIVPILIAVLLWRASQNDPQQRGDWRDFAILLILGLAVDLRWLESAWPAHLGIISKMILLDAGVYGFLVIRQLSNVGFDLRIKRIDVKVGFRELTFYAPFALILGLTLGFLHAHLRIPSIKSVALALVFTFLLIAVPEEIFFRGWMQNLLERRIGKVPSLLLTSAIFGLSHFNKRSAHFNWKYVLLATIAGIFYGRAWRENHRIAASSITHAAVDTIWSLWLQ